MPVSWVEWIWIGLNPGLITMLGSSTKLHSALQAAPTTNPAPTPVHVRRREIGESAEGASDDEEIEHHDRVERRALEVRGAEPMPDARQEHQQAQECPANPEQEAPGE